MAFSLRKNLKSLLSLERPENDIASVHGIRFLNAFMLIAAHKSMALFFNPYINRVEMSEVNNISSPSSSSASSSPTTLNFVCFVGFGPAVERDRPSGKSIHRSFHNVEWNADGPLYFREAQSYRKIGCLPRIYVQTFQVTFLIAIQNDYLIIDSFLGWYQPSAL